MSLFPDIEQLRVEGPRRIAAGAATGQRMFDKYAGSTGMSVSPEYGGAMAGLFSRAQREATQNQASRLKESQLRADLQKDKLSALLEQLSNQRKAAKASQQGGLFGTLAGLGGSILGTLWPQRSAMPPGGASPFSAPAGFSPWAPYGGAGPSSLGGFLGGIGGGY